jgi:HEAT repeat protein
MEMLSEEESATAAGPRAAAPAESPPMATVGAGGSDMTEGEMLAFAAPRAPRESLTELLADLKAAQSPNVAARLLDEVVELTDAAVRDGQPLTVADGYAALVSGEVAAGEGPLKRPYQMALRRLTKPTVLRVVAQMLVQRPARETEYFAALTRAGDDGAEALIEQLTNASSLADRRIYFNALVRLNTGVPALLHMLGDARWYVVRNAADLLGELQVAAAEQPLSELFRHDDERVRRAAAAALGKLGTPRATQLLHQALRDGSPQVRTQAVVGITAGKGKNAAAILGDALESESDGEVQLSILSALGRIASPDAVQRLIKLAEPEGRLFKKKPVTHRVAAVQALGEARTPLAINALSNLLTDKEKEVRDAAVRAIRTSAASKGAE